VGVGEVQNGAAQRAEHVEDQHVLKIWLVRINQRDLEFVGAHHFLQVDGDRLRLADARIQLHDFRVVVVLVDAQFQHFLLLDGGLLDLDIGGPHLHVQVDFDEVVSVGLLGVGHPPFAVGVIGEGSRTEVLIVLVGRTNTLAVDGHAILVLQAAVCDSQYLAAAREGVVVHKVEVDEDHQVRVGDDRVELQVELDLAHGLVVPLHFERAFIPGVNFTRLAGLEAV